MNGTENGVVKIKTEVKEEFDQLQQQADDKNCIENNNKMAAASKSDSELEISIPPGNFFNRIPSYPNNRILFFHQPCNCTNIYQRKALKCSN